MTAKYTYMMTFYGEQRFAKSSELFASLVDPKRSPGWNGKCSTARRSAETRCGHAPYVSLSFALAGGTAWAAVHSHSHHNGARLNLDDTTSDLWTPSPADMGPRVVKQLLTSPLDTETKPTAGETSSGATKQGPVAAPYDWKAFLNSLPTYSFRDANISRRVTYFNNLDASDQAALRFSTFVHYLILGEENSILTPLTQLRCDRDRCRMVAYKETE